MKILSLLVFFSFYAASTTGRFPASIKSMEKTYQDQKVLSVLEQNVKLVVKVREEFMDRHIKKFKESKNLSSADFQTFQQELDFILNLKSVIDKEKTQGKEVKTTSPVALVSSFNQQQKKEMQEFYDYFNKHALPELKLGIEHKDKSKIISGLEKWKQNNIRYTAFIQNRITEYASKTGLKKQKL